MKPTLPDDVTIETKAFQQATFIERAIDNVQRALLEGGILVAIVLFLFLWNFRTTFISLTAIPLSLITAIIAMSYFGIGINTMTLGGLAIAIGELVDDAIIDVENVFRRLKQNAHSGFHSNAGNRDLQGVQRNPEFHRVRDADHRPGVPAAFQSRWLRRPDVCASRVCLHRFDCRIAARRADRDSGALLLPARPIQAIAGREGFLARGLAQRRVMRKSWIGRWSIPFKSSVLRWLCWSSR